MEEAQAEVSCSIPGIVSVRFWSRVDMSGGPDACWPWTLGCDKGGYGHFQAGSRIGGIKRGPRQAHRVAYELTFGPLPVGQVVRHKKCDNPPCCNPAHLRLGTQADNQADMVAAGRQAKGEKNSHAKLTADDVLAIRAMDDSDADVAKRYGVSYGAIWQLRNGRTWRHLPMARAASQLLAGRGPGGTT